MSLDSFIQKQGFDEKQLILPGISATTGALIAYVLASKLNQSPLKKLRSVAIGTGVGAGTGLLQNLIVNGMKT